MKKKILKHDFTKNKRFIDTILQLNFLTPSNIDISSISPITHEAGNQPPGKQNYEKKGIELNNQQKQEKNKSS